MSVDTFIHKNLSKECWTASDLLEMGPAWRMMVHRPSSKLLITFIDVAGTTIIVEWWWWCDSTEEKPLTTFGISFFFFLSKHSLPILILMSRFDSSDEKLKWWRRFLSRLDESYDDKRELKTKLKFIKTVILYQTIN